MKPYDIRYAFPDLMSRIAAMFREERRKQDPRHQLDAGAAARRIHALADLAPKASNYARANACVEIGALALRIALDAEPGKRQAAEPASLEIGLDFAASELPRRVTPDMVDAVISDESFHVPPGTSLTIATLTLNNGFTVTGESACADPAAFNAELGRDLAKGKAREKIFSLLAFLICEEQFRERTRRARAIEVLSRSETAAEDTLIKSVLEKAAI